MGSHFFIRSVTTTDISTAAVPLVAAEILDCPPEEKSPEPRLLCSMTCGSIQLPEKYSGAFKARAAPVAGDIITTPLVILMTDGQRSRIEVQWVKSGDTWEAFGFIDGED